MVVRQQQYHLSPIGSLYAVSEEERSDSRSVRNAP